MSSWTTSVAPLLQGFDSSLEREPMLRRAVAMAEDLYGDEKHWTGVSLLEHTLGVLRILLPFQPDADSVAACLLQHALRTRKISLPELEEEVGAGVRSLVSSVHLLSHVTQRSRKSSIEDLRLMLLSVSDDVRVLLVILCDRCYVLEHLAHVSPVDRRRTCRDVLNLFAPVAARLGIHALKQRLESLAFPQVYTLEAEWITDQLRLLHTRHGDFLEAAADALTAGLREQGIESVIQGREKLPYSIFSKMRSRSMSSMDGLPDLFALRVIVRTEEDCYRVLGVLHRLGRPVPNRFKDYIAFPKPNGYQSLHTTMARLQGVPDGVFVEVQVRTHAMHREAEFGIAAHWSYKEGGQAERMLQRVQLQQVLSSQQAVGAEAAEATLADHIFVLTPKGDIIELPEGATPLDFAFQIHTELGLRFRSARVNGSIVPLDYELENGDVVEILSHKTPQPSSEWLQLLKMASSRSRLKRYLHTIDRSLYVQEGKEMLNEELRRRHIPLLDADLSIMRRYDGRILAFEEREDVLSKLGQHSDRVSSVLSRLEDLRGVLSRVPMQKRKVVTGLPSGQPVEVDGGSTPMPVRFAKCCAADALPREKIIGLISRRGDVMVHRAKCRMLRKVNPERRVGVRWRKP